MSYSPTAGKFKEKKERMGIKGTSHRISWPALNKKTRTSLWKHGRLLPQAVEEDR